jgi:hypothetical protein
VRLTVLIKKLSRKQINEIKRVLTDNSKDAEVERKPAGMYRIVEETERRFVKRRVRK